jgi:hypothetical protein
MDIEDLAYFEQRILPHWMRNRCETQDKTATTRTDLLYHSVCQHMLDHGEPNVPQRQEFVRAMDRAGFKQFKKYRSFPQVIAGVALRQT